MRYLAIAVHFAETAVLLAFLALFAMGALPVVAMYRLARWAELQVAYGGDERARDKDKWRLD